MWWEERKTLDALSIIPLSIALKVLWKSLKESKAICYNVTFNMCFEMEKVISTLEQYKIHVPSDIKFAEYAVFSARFTKLINLTIRYLPILIPNH